MTTLDRLKRINAILDEYETEPNIERERYLLLNGLTDLAIVIDTCGTIKFVNPACYRLLGYDPNELVGYNIVTLLPDEHKDKHKQYIQNYLDTGIRKILSTGREVEVRHKDGHFVTMHLYVGEIEHNDCCHLFIGILRKVVNG